MWSALSSPTGHSRLAGCSEVRCSHDASSRLLRVHRRGEELCHRAAASAPHRLRGRPSSRFAPQALFGFGKKKAPVAPVVRETVVPAPSYNLPIALIGIAGLSAAIDNKILAGLTGILGIFLAFQVANQLHSTLGSLFMHLKHHIDADVFSALFKASRVKFRFDDVALEVLIGDSEEQTENSFVGGPNRWKYDTFTNWEYWWKNFPVLVYFKENQTKPEGQIHFFPIIFNGKQLYNVMAERCGSSQNSGPE